MATLSASTDGVVPEIGENPIGRRWCQLIDSAAGGGIQARLCSAEQITRRIDDGASRRELEVKPSDG